MIISDGKLQNDDDVLIDYLQNRCDDRCVEYDIEDFMYDDNEDQ